MPILFDNGTPRTPARYPIDRHAVTEARARGREELQNGALLTVAESAGFDVPVTTDRNLSCRQNLAGRGIAVVVPQKAAGASSSRTCRKLSPRKTPQLPAALSRWKSLASRFPCVAQRVSAEPSSEGLQTGHLRRVKYQGQNVRVKYGYTGAPAPARHFQSLSSPLS